MPTADMQCAPQRFASYKLGSLSIAAQARPPSVSLVAERGISGNHRGCCVGARNHVQQRERRRQDATNVA